MLSWWRVFCWPMLPHWQWRWQSVNWWYLKTSDLTIHKMLLQPMISSSEWIDSSPLITLSEAALCFRQSKQRSDYYLLHGVPKFLVETPHRHYIRSKTEPMQGGKKSSGTLKRHWGCCQGQNANSSIFYLQTALRERPAHLHTIRSRPTKSHPISFLNH